MAACTLKIELDDPAAIWRGGDTVTGSVVVQTTTAVRCQGLVVSMRWTTHGRGNVDKGEGDQQILFQGAWEPGREYRYPFQLRCTDWPPTYYGTYLSVSHFIAAQAKVPWSVDPKTQREIMVVARQAPADLAPSQFSIWRTIPRPAWPVAAVLAVVFLLLFSGLLLILLPIAGVAAACYWFFRVFLPTRLLGKVAFAVDQSRVAAGTPVTGRLQFTPPRTVSIDGIEWTVTCGEKCESGSGSNKQTHRHEVLKLREQIAEPGSLPVGQPQTFHFSTLIPPEAPVSLKFHSNELTWKGELRIAILRWPDWVKTVPLLVAPGADAAEAIAAPQVDQEAASPGGASDEAWFTEVLEQVARSRDDPGRLRTVLNAIQGQQFVLRAELSPPVAEGPMHAMSESGTWTSAVCRPQGAELWLFWPAPLQPPSQRRTDWSGKATAVGYDDQLGRLLMRVEPSEAVPPRR